MNVYYETITHHGVEGQKWGVRNGPPYPLANNREYLKKRRHIIDVIYYVIDNTQMT